LEDISYCLLYLEGVHLRDELVVVEEGGVGLEVVEDPLLVGGGPAVVDRDLVRQALRLDQLIIKPERGNPLLVLQ